VRLHERADKEFSAATIPIHTCIHTYIHEHS
jgi:hypothetical protein